MYRGWIILPSDIGGKIVVECDLFLYGMDEWGAHKVGLSDKGFEKLGKYWGDAVWGLEHCEG